ncbi:MAG TPA: hypothetical protein VHB50_15045, partial [Bryobacteraceae bacterium]|nr:hypothetical protein [Bryobacteraceae bacterium]
TKRSEDVRARIALLSEIPDEWRIAVESWAARNERHKRGGAPDRNTEYLVYQTMVGAWPITLERLSAYMVKACREAKEQTKWTEPNPEFEAALAEFLGAILEDDEFLRDFEAFTSGLIHAGRVNSLSQTLVRMMAPGVPDIYQGTEIWDLSLVDPDNRRPVDYEFRRRLIGEMEGLSAEEIMARMDEGMPKLWVIRQALKLRREQAACFGPGSPYSPLYARGAHANRAVCFRRADDVIVIAPRFQFGAKDGWADTGLDLPEGGWSNLLTGETVTGGFLPLGNLFRRFPAALLLREGWACA